MSESNEGFEIPDLSYKVDSSHKREPIQDYAHKQHVVAELRAHADHLGKAYPQPLWDFVEGSLFTSNAYGVIYDAPNGQRLFHYPTLPVEQAQDQSPQKPVLRIADPVAFLDALQTFHTAVYSSGSDWQLSRTRAGLMRINPTELIWNNATEADFHDPVQFLQRETNFLQDETFATLTADWHPHGQVPSLENRRLFLRRERARLDYETPYLLQPALASQKGAPEIPLPCIRYGINTTRDQKIAYLYSLQMPDWSQIPTPDEIRQLHSDDQADMTNDLRLFRAGLAAQPELFATYFQDLPSEILDSQTDPLAAYWLLHQFLTDKGFSDINNPFATLYQKLEREAGDLRTPASRAAQSLNYILTMSDAYKAKATEYQLLLEREQLRKQLNRHARSETSPQALASATIFFHLLAEEGITEVRIPTFLPLRVQMHERKLGEEQTAQTDGRMTWNLIGVAQQLQKDLSGVQIVSYPFEGDDSAGILHLRLEPPLTSQKPLLQQLQAVI